MARRGGPYAGPVETWPEIKVAAILGEAFGQDPVALLRSTPEEWDIRIAAHRALAAAHDKATRTPPERRG